MTIKAFINYDVHTDSTVAAIRRQLQDGTRLYATPIEFREMKPIDDKMMLQDDEFTTEEFLQAVVDAAWEYGIRPTNFKDHTNELTAVRYHLEDMRKLTGLQGEEE